MRLGDAVSLKHGADRHPGLKLIGCRRGLNGNSKVDSGLDDFIVECLQAHRIAADDRQKPTQLVIYLRS